MITESLPAWLSEPIRTAITPSTAFSEAADAWLHARASDSGNRWGFRELRKSTEDSYRAYVTSLKLFFGTLPLEAIRLDHIARYQQTRRTGAEPFVRYRRPQDAKGKTLADGTVIPPRGKTPCPASAKRVNQELAVLIRILRRARLWGEEQEELYEPLIENFEEIPRALTPAEQRHWLRVAYSNSRWHLVYHYSVLAFATCMGTNEIRSLRFCDINAAAGCLTVPVEGAKNRYRHRTIRFGTPEAAYAVEWLLARANSLGAKEPQHYLFPRRNAPERWDATKPMTESGIKKAWEEVRAAAHLSWFRQYDCRHTAITRLAEAGTPIGVIMSLAGHISPLMTRHYTHISEQLQVQAMQRTQRMLTEVPGYPDYSDVPTPRRNDFIVFPGGRK